MSHVSIIIPVYNRQKYIGEAIKSVLAQTYKNYEIIVVDDGSSDDVKNALKPYMSKIKYVYQENRGLAAARNTGIKHSQGKYLAFLDDDDLFEPLKLETQVQILESNSELGFVYSGYYYFENNGPTKHILTLPQEKDKSNEEFSKEYFLKHDIPISTLLVFRKSVEDVGLFDECLRANEDVDMWLRLSMRWPGKFSDYPSTRIRLHDNRMSHDRVLIYELLIKCLDKTLKAHPEFKKSLGKDADKKITKTHYLLGKELLKSNKKNRALKEFLICAKSYKPVKPILKILKGLRDLCLRNYIREMNFMSGSTTWRDCKTILFSLLLGKDVVDGPYIRRYEMSFSKYLGIKHTFSFGAGRMAFYAILKALGVKEGDEVILPAYSCVVIPNAIIYCGAKPIYVDIVPGSLNIDTVKIEEKITSQTKAICVQHTFGSFCDMDTVKKIARKYDLKIIEDCAHALGAEYKGKTAGTFGDAAIFTTEQSKIISTGMGGVAVTNDEKIACNIKKIQAKSEFYDKKKTRKIVRQVFLHNILFHPLIYFFGKYILFMLSKFNIFLDSTSEYEMEGMRPEKYPVRLSNIQARIGLSQLNRLGNNLEHRRRIASSYREILAKYGFKVPENYENSFNPSYIRYWFLVEDREKAKKIFRKSGIELGEWFSHPVHPKGTNSDNLFYKEGSNPNAEFITKHNVNLPTHPKVKFKDVKRVEKVLKTLRIEENK